MNNSELARNIANLSSKRQMIVYSLITWFFFLKFLRQPTRDNWRMAAGLFKFFVWPQLWPLIWKGAAWLGFAALMVATLANLF